MPDCARLESRLALAIQAYNTVRFSTLHAAAIAYDAPGNALREGLKVPVPKTNLGFLAAKQVKSRRMYRYPRLQN
jgi:hypothetical protein